MSKCQIDTDPLYLSVCNKGTKGCTVAHKTVSELEYLLSASQAREAALREKLATQKKHLDEFDELTDELTKGYGAASCINPVTDMRNAITKIRELLVAAEQRAEAAEASIKASQEQEPFAYMTELGVKWLAEDGSAVISERCRGDNSVYLYLAPVIQPELAELQRENAELRKLLESKVPDWKSIIIDRLHSKVGVCMTCGQHKCPHVSNTTLPDTVQIDDVLWCINLDEYFFKEEIQPKEPKQ